nr:hypothetical protein BaRGS_008696 [Batillaria attramentaria]
MLGVAGGSHFGHTGGGANRLCLTKEPVFDSTPTESVYGELSGMEYYLHGHLYTDVVCAVCRAPALTEPVEVVVERQSQELAALKADHATLKSDLETTQGAFKVLQTQMNALTDSVRAQLHVLHLGTSGSGGTTGGVVGGAYAHDPGAGANRLCMTLEPTFENVTQDQSGEIDGVEYIIPGHHNEDAVCSFCKASYATTFMVPGTTT